MFDYVESALEEALTLYREADCDLDRMRAWGFAQAAADEMKRECEADILTAKHVRTVQEVIEANLGQEFSFLYQGKKDSNPKLRRVQPLQLEFDEDSDVVRFFYAHDLDDSDRFKRFDFARCQLVDSGELS